jgi:class 3 adenylate cyclase/tetratricopeptide (TPR) repeat protein
MAWPCADCAGENLDGTRFCGHCGKPRATAAPAAPDLQATVADVAELISSTLAGGRGEAAGGEVVNRPLVDRLASARVGVEERRLITAVFADVSGFTALAHSLDAERLVGIIGPIVSRLANIVTRYGGYVGKFAGDAILAFFGAPVTHEDDAVRALLAARDMQRESAELFAELGPEASGLTLHVGVNTGYVVAGFFGDEVRMEYSVLGDAVNVAQRLESAAPGGAIYVGHDTHLLARSQFVFEDLGAIQVKGKPQPIPCFRLVGRAQDGADLPVSATGRLVGRGRELAVLTRVLMPVAGGGGVAAVAGEPGTGKSALLREARRWGVDAGARWVETHCVAYRSRPYRPYVELLRVTTEIPEDVEPTAAAERIVAEAARAGVPKAAPFFLRLLGLAAPDGVEDAAPTDPLAFRQGLHEAVADYLVARAAEAPMVVAIEDVHWADASTVDLTRQLVARTRHAPFSIVVTARPEGRDTAAALIDANPRSAAVDLGPLDRVATGELATEVLDGPASAELVAMVAERTSGNPLFVEQLLRSLQESDALERLPDGWHLQRGRSGDGVPTAVEQVLAARIDQLPRPAADLLQVASVIGRAVLPALLRQVAGGGAEHEAAVDLLLGSGFFEVVDDGGETRLSFHHALLVDVAYGRLLRSRRRAVHREVVAAITELYGTGDDVVDMLARHAQRGDMGAPAVDFLERAGARAESLFANDQATAYLRQAIEIAERDGAAEARLTELLLRCARVEETRGGYQEALELYERAVARGPDLRAQLGRASTLRKLGEYGRCLDAIHAAAAAHPDLQPDEVARLALEEGWVLGLVGDTRRAVETLGGGVRQIEGRGSPSLEAQLLVMLARTEQLAGDDDQALVHAERARNLLEAARDLPVLASALRVLGGIQADTAGSEPALLQVARGSLDRALELARRVGDAEEAAAALINLGRTLSELGLHEEALSCDVEAAEAFASVGLKSGVACAYCNLADHLVRVDRPADALAAARTGLAVAEEIGNPYWIAGAQIGISTGSLRLGDAAEAARTGEACFDFSVAAALPQRVHGALDAALRAVRSLGDREGERRLLAKARAAGISEGGEERAAPLAAADNGG